MAAEQPAVLAQALAAARSITGDYTRVRVLGSLAPGLPPELFPQALAAVFAMPGGSGRAEALAALAPRLPPDLLAQALAAATAITDNSGRAEALISLVPHLPADQQGGALSQALAAASRTGSETRVKVLKTARSAHFRDGSGSYVHLLRDSLSGIDRTVCLRVIEAAAPAISEIGGGAAIQQCVDAIVAAHRWWP